MHIIGLVILILICLLIFVLIGSMIRNKCKLINSDTNTIDNFNDDEIYYAIIKKQNCASYNSHNNDHNDSDEYIITNKVIMNDIEQQ